MSSLTVIEKSERLEIFLEKRYWKIEDKGKFKKCYAPEKSNWSPYYLILPNVSDDETVVQRIINDALFNISELYKINEDDLQSILFDDYNYILLKLNGKSVDGNSFSFWHYKEFLAKLHRALKDISNYTINQIPFNESDEKESNYFLNSCMLAQSGKGSYITKIQMPAKKSLKTYFKSNIDSSVEFTTEDVYRNFLILYKYICSYIFKYEKKILDEDHLYNEINNINLNFIESIYKLIKCSDIDNLDLEFISIGNSESVKSGFIGDGRLAFFKSYVEFLKEKLQDKTRLNVKGRIVELRSRNPDWNYNYIVMTCVINESEANLAMNLNNKYYRNAIQAHRESREIRVIGDVIKMKTQYKVVNLESLEIL